MMVEKNPDVRPGPLAEVRDLATSVSGVISGLTILIPALNHVLPVVPLVPYQETVQVSLASLFALFALALTFTVRSARLTRSASLSVVLFVCAILSIAFYLTLFGQLDAFDSVKSTALLLLYAISAGCLTAAFSVIAVREYIQPHSPRGASHDDA